MAEFVFLLYYRNQEGFPLVVNTYYILLVTTQPTHLIDIRVHRDPGDCKLLERNGRAVFKLHRDTYWCAVLLG